MQQKNKKRKWLSILLILAMVLSMFPQTGLSWLLPVTAAAAETGNENVAPTPEFFNELWDLSTQSTTMYTDNTVVLRVRFKKNTSAHTKDTLDIEWQVSDDGEKFTAIENPKVTWEEDWYRSTLYPEQEFGTTKYYRAKITNKGLKEGMTPSTIYSEVATIKAVNEEEPGYILNMPVVRKADGSFETDPNIKVEITTPKVTDYTKDPLVRGNTYSKNASFIGMMPDTWDHDLYRFVGWKIGNQVCDGTKEKSEAPKYKATEENEWAQYVEAENLSFSGYYYVANPGTALETVRYHLAIFADSDIKALKALHVAPVFDLKPEMEYKITVAETENGSVIRKRLEGETHTLTAVPDDLFTLDHWETSTDDGKTWTKMDGAEEVTVELKEDTSYRAIFVPYQITKLENVKYALPAEGDSWFIETNVRLNTEETSKLNYKTRIYDGETADKDKLLGEATYGVAAENYTAKVRATAKKRPSSDTGKVLLEIELPNGEKIQQVCTLIGTFEIVPAVQDINVQDAYFFNTVSNTVQLETAGNPEPGRVVWSGGAAPPTQPTNYAIIGKYSGVVTYGSYLVNRTETFMADAGDGRIAEAKINFKMPGMGVKVDAKQITMKENDELTYTAVLTRSNISASRNKVTVTSTNTDVFTAEMTTKEMSSWMKDVPDKIIVKAVGSGEAELVIDVNGTKWSCPVYVTSSDVVVTGVTLSKTEATLTVGSSLTLDATITPGTAATTTVWSSSHPSIVSVDNGVVTAQKKGSATITATVTDTKGNTVSASCKVTVPEKEYQVVLYAPEELVGRDGVKVYKAGSDTPLTGLDCMGADDEGYNSYLITLKQGTYTYEVTSKEGKSLGGGTIEVPNGKMGVLDDANMEIYLRCAEVSVTNEYDNQKAQAGDFTVTIQGMASGEYTVGDPYADAAGNTIYPVMLCANGTDMLYHLTVTPSEKYVAAHNVKAYTKAEIEVEKKLAVLPLSVTLQEGCFTINAPADAEVLLNDRRTTQYSLQIKEIKPDETQTQEDGTVDYLFHVDITSDMTYRVKGDSYVTYAGSVEPGTTERLVVTKEMLQPAGKSKTTIDRDVNSNGGANIADIYLNINAKGYLKLENGNSYQLKAKRNWWGSNVTWVLSGYKYLIEPEYHYTVVDINGQGTSDVVTVDENGKLTANKEGTAIVLVTYDSMTLKYHDKALVSYEGYNPNGFFGAIWPENTGVFVVSVGEDNSNIVTGMTLNAEGNKGKSKVAGDALDAELDPIYYTGDTGSYTFTPVTKGLTVSVANPSVGANTVSYTGFTPVAEQDGSFSVPLKQGRNIVKLEKGDQVEYQIITAKQVSVTVNGKSLENAVVSPGENVSIKFDTLYAPLTRMRIYNIDSAPTYTKVSGLEGKTAGAGRGSYGYYFFASTEEKQTIHNIVEEGVDDSGWANPIVTVKEELAVPEDFDGSVFTLSGGRFNVAGFGADYGKHRTDEALPGGLSPNTMAYLGQLPDLEIPVATLDSVKVTTMPTKLEYNLGETFDPEGMIVTVSYKGGSGTLEREVSDFTYSKEAFTEAGKQNVTISYTQAGVTKETTIEVTVKQVALEKLEITTLPTKTLYNVGDTFDPTGMVVTATYDDGNTKEIKNYKVSPEKIAADTKEITITYDNKEVKVPIELNLVTSIAITTVPTKVVYNAGEIFNTSGMVVTATYKDGTTKDTTAYRYTPAGKLKESDTVITISYKGDDADPNLQPVTQQITVNAEKEEPYSYITAYVSYSSKGEPVYSEDGICMYYVPVKVYDRDEDQNYTMGDAFRAFHEQYYSGGADGYDDMFTELGGWVNRFWGKQDSNLSYTKNHDWVVGPLTPIADGDKLDVFLYEDLTTYKDLYTWFEADEYTTDANVQTTFTVYGASIMNSSDTKLTTAAPAGATVTIFDANGENVGTTTVGEDGTFGITFASDGIYTILVSGLSTYTCETYGGGAANTYTDATVVPSWCTVKVGNVPEEPEYVKGDVNNDGYIDMIDVVQLQDAVTEESEVVLDVCDINGDGFVDMIDVVQLQDMVTEAE